MRDRRSNLWCLGLDHWLASSRWEQPIEELRKKVGENYSRACAVRHLTQPATTAPGRLEETCGRSHERSFLGGTYSRLQEGMERSSANQALAFGAPVPPSLGLFSSPVTALHPVLERSPSSPGGGGGRPPLSVTERPIKPQDADSSSRLPLLFSARVLSVVWC